MDTKKRGELDEKDFIQESKTRPPLSYWLIILVIIGIIALMMFGISKWTPSERPVKPFLQVTNREFSLFLWQNPEYMRSNYKDKTGYLPGFSLTTIKPEMADEYIAAPPEVLFLYHAWKRLVGNDSFPRIITEAEFKEFLASDQQWQSKDHNDPFVKQAFIGWKNFHREGDLINQMSYTYADAKKLIETHPGYACSHWRNIYPNYLKSLPTADPFSKIPNEEIPSFLRVALYNYKNASTKFT